MTLAKENKMILNIGDNVQFINGPSVFVGRINAFIGASYVLVGLSKVHRQQIVRTVDYCDMCGGLCNVNDNGLSSICDSCRNSLE